MFAFETTQGKIFFIVNILLILIIVGLSLFNGAILPVIIGIIPSIIYILIGTFLIKCLVTGDCNKTAWFFTIINIIIPLIMISFLVMGITGSIIN